MSSDMKGQGVSSSSLVTRKVRGLTPMASHVPGEERSRGHGFPRFAHFPCSLHGMRSVWLGQ